MTQLRCLINAERLIGDRFRATSQPAKNGFLCGSWSKEHLWEPTFDLLRNKAVVELSVVGRLPEIVVGLTEGLYVSSFMTAEGNPEWCLFDRRGNNLRTLSVLDGNLNVSVTAHRSTEGAAKGHD